MATMHQSRNLSVSINRDARDVYNFISVPENFRLWASGLGKALKNVNGEWVAETPEGPVKVRFSERNELGGSGSLGKPETRAADLYSHAGYSKRQRQRAHFYVVPFV